MSRDSLSSDSISKASKSRAKESDHGGKGAGGKVQDGMDRNLRELAGEQLSDLIQLPEGCSECVKIGLSWNNIVMIQEEGLLNQIMKKMKKAGVDLDLGCLYELKSGDRGALQAFGELYGNYDQAPFIHHGGDERTGDTEGFDEYLEVNGAKWDEIERILIYCYIYKGPEVWQEIMPEISISIASMGEKKLTLNSYEKNIPICALATLKNVRGAIEVTKHAEYFRSHTSMDSAFGYGIRWEEGEKK